MSESDGNTAMVTVKMWAFLSGFSCPTPTLLLLAPILLGLGEATHSELLDRKRVKQDRRSHCSVDVALPLVLGSVTFTFFYRLVCGSDDLSKTQTLHCFVDLALPLSLSQQAGVWLRWSKQVKYTFFWQPFSAFELVCMNTSAGKIVKTSGTQNTGRQIKKNMNLLQKV